MEMRLHIEDSGLLRWEHRLIGQERLRTPVSFVPAADAHPRRLHVRCSMCNRLKGQRGWNEPDDEVLLATPNEPVIPVIYGVCPDCLSAHPAGRF